MALQIVLVNPLGEVMEKLQRAEETHDFMKPKNLYLTVGEAVASLSSLVKVVHSSVLYDEGRRQGNSYQYQN